MKRLLVANRGEIAVRIIRTAHEMGLETVLAVSEADRASLAAELSDYVTVIGPAQAGQSYLNSAAVIAAIHSSGADSVHPGYGFLSEDAEFARSVEAAGAIWVGPSPDSIALMGNKAAARQSAKDAGVPVLVGSEGAIAADDDVKAIAEAIGFPLLIKASAGGGGRGIRIVDNVDALQGEIKLAVAEAGAAFGDPAIYLERFIDKARHVEVQILGDGVDVVHLFDRDCSLQRRQQKIVEETPAPNLPDHLRQRMLSAAVDLGKRCAYRGAGTVEFLYDEARGEICFIEMNTRLQVEHPVTEMITGIDLVREQLRIAGGEKLGYDQQSITRNGHAIEMRINAENPAMGFTPSPGTITEVRYPGGPGVRVDSGVVSGSAVSPYYDSLVAKVIVWHNDRPSAIGRALRALSELRVEGVETTTTYLESVLAHSAVASATHHTKFLEQSADQLLQGIS
ncbi:acetyl-CoA carboxylase biotin carboxylase subunit [Rhodococcoides fascians]|uniref:acetyl-CoA carboxylase biotin carboxylase subunit n=1 Tax=Rhodococcoides fascians TaxID=1828 RepID=UPI000B9B5C3D|nr:acetyl-CoA carboxylase biotin carboxylase subunit [Rhodococcus fascians]OZE85349.1 acetyl-CoA carboxylase biotin carboxylase subunit [Rhodococcus fascians]OZF11856.1 acetyl-CoA carboxylase biotin carboxylase subunit [Rhodococcus fascians]OZF14625.1 acetyl-CoA carboxylase biotin carboxylase subunit [Rhodococcus fascians]OZF61202.1 acetyl-CoA carboxylase biotin carboxylase subunit [Rhodococcus fascians]OZF64306.1 acetyl-CoA carboxylase biotin carboxylase subunit [Rhodococcus fascians]